MGIKDRLNYYASFSDQDVFQPGKFNPGLFKMIKKKLKALRPGVYSIFKLLIGNTNDNPGCTESCLNDGDIQPAVVVSTSPLLVASYTDEMDAVIMLYFPEELGLKRSWTVGKKLITVNSYNALGPVRKNNDIYPGPASSGKYRSIGPIVAELYTDNQERVARKVSEIPEELYQHAFNLGKEYMAEHPGMARNGLGFAYKNAQKIDTIKFSSSIKYD